MTLTINSAICYFKSIMKLHKHKANSYPPTLVVPGDFLIKFGKRSTGKQTIESINTPFVGYIIRLYLL